MECLIRAGRFKAVSVYVNIRIFCYISSFAFADPVISCAVHDGTVPVAFRQI